MAAILPAATPTSSEMADAEHWIAAKFRGEVTRPEPTAQLLIISHEGSINFDPSHAFDRNNRNGSPLRLNRREYPHGLFAHSATRLAVLLPAPAKTFSATAGIDDSTTGCTYRGVIFSVTASGKTFFRKQLAPGASAESISVDLSGATQFQIDARNPGNQQCSDADWVNAQVTLEDGRTLWLEELPVGPLPPPYSTDLPFSFRYAGRSSKLFLPQWKQSTASRELDSNRTEWTRSYTDPNTGLVLRWVAVIYQDFPTVEWTLYFKNTAAIDTPILEDIQALDTTLERSAEQEFVLRHFRGSRESPNDYEPFATPLPARSGQRYAASGGRPTNTDLSYFDIAWANQGAIVSIGWPGQWAARFDRDEATGLRITSGQELTHFLLHPGEEVRSPLIVLQFWRGDWLHAQNVWRSWMIAHNVPRVHGQLPPPQISAGGLMTEDQSSVVDNYTGHGIPLDYLWLDAGWYPYKEGWWNVGTWEPDPKRFPHGLKPLSDNAHSHGIKMILWFEPERVTAGTGLWEHHPEWLLHDSGSNKLLDLGNPAALRWLVDHVDQLISEQGINYYREDFNFDPLSIWRANDTNDRQGITEIRDVTGHLAYWDELLRHNPTLRIDTCASGGRRIDVETLRRSVPLWRSDYAIEPDGMQQQTYGLAFWLPYFGTAVNGADPYTFESQMTPGLSIGIDFKAPPESIAESKKLINDWQKIAPAYYGDYYPLTPYASTNDAWLAWQFNRPDQGRGFIQAFRRPDALYSAAQFDLQGIDEHERYTITNLDTGSITEVSGADMQKAFTISLPTARSSALLEYHRLETNSPSTESTKPSQF